MIENKVVSKLDPIIWSAIILSLCKWSDSDIFVSLEVA